MHVADISVIDSMANKSDGFDTVIGQVDQI